MTLIHLELDGESLTFTENADLSELRITCDGSHWTIELPSEFVDDFLRLERHLGGQSMWRMLALWGIDQLP